MRFPEATEQWKEKFLELIETAIYIPQCTLEDYFAMDDYRKTFDNTANWFGEIRLYGVYDNPSLSQYIAEKIQDDFDKWVWYNNPDEHDLLDNDDEYVNDDEYIFGFNDFFYAVCNTFTLEELKTAVEKGVDRTAEVFRIEITPDGRTIHVMDFKRKRDNS